MQKIICKKLYDTETSEVVKKNIYGYFGDPYGYEETLYKTEGGLYFLYTAGGESSKYPKEDIKRLSKKAAEEWLNNN